MDVIKADINSIPENLLLEIFKHLDKKELCIACRVCRSWRRIANDNTMWRHVDLTPYKLNLCRMWKMIRSHFSDVLLSLKFRGYHEPKSPDLLRNSMSAAMLSELRNRCPNITTLVLIKNQFTKVKLEDLPKTLTVLKLNKSFIPPKWFRGIGEHLPRLKVLDISECSKTSDYDITAIADGCPDLQELYLNHCYRLSSYWYDKKLVNLKVLEIAENRVSDLNLHHLCRNMKELRALNLRRAIDIPGSLSEVSHLAVSNYISNLPNLQRLDLTYCKLVSDKTIPYLSQITTLQYLNLSHTEVTQKGLNSFIEVHENSKNVKIVCQHLDNLKEDKKSSKELESESVDQTQDY